MGKTPSFTFSFCSSLITMALENFEGFEYPCDVETSMVLLRATLDAVRALLRLKRVFKSTTQRSAQRHGMGENVGKYLENLAPPKVWNFTPKQLQDPDREMEYLKGKCCDYSKEAQLRALGLALASI